MIEQSALKPEKNFSIIDLINQLLTHAIDLKASDIHLEPTLIALRVRFRIDGVLYDQESIPRTYMQQLATRIKIVSNINISQKRVPQDGKFCIPHNDTSIDCRVSTFPSLYGEKIVIRILDRGQQAISLDKLGFSSAGLLSFKQLIAKANGFILVTGPTGSGKTTTLYAALNEIAIPQRNIITLEDPVEYNIDGITQGQIHPEAGFTFERGIRALLRQDPDIAMIGEIRDRQTARIAIEASLTGHLVLSTLHTNDAPSAIMRLMDMNIEPFLINASLTGILAQRLARKICSYCKIKYEPDLQEQEQLKKLNLAETNLYKGNGCSVCLNTGYKGRIGIFELLIISNKLRSLVVQHPIFEAVYQQALDDGMQPLLHDGFIKVQQGIISLSELLRILN